MSLSPPRTRANGRRSFNQYNCYQCHRPVRIASDGPSNEAVCPGCCHRLLYWRLYSINYTGTRSVFELIGFDPSPLVRMFEDWTITVVPPPGLRNPGTENGAYQVPNLVDTWNNYRQGRRRFEDIEDSRNQSWFCLFNENNDRHGPESGILARPQPRPRTRVIPRRTSPNPTVRNRPGERTAPPYVEPGNYYTGPGLQELIEELTENDRLGPPPAPKSTIDAIPTIKIASTHLATDPECTVCLEKFNIGVEVRELPCNHIYHSDCIITWLSLHNACPICRQELAGPPRNQETTNDGTHRKDGGCWGRRQLANLLRSQSRYRTLNSNGGGSRSTRQPAAESWNCNIL
ncbi:hypothetical protein OROHE_018592 [Orobanche hederae]